MPGDLERLREKLGLPLSRLPLRLPGTCPEWTGQLRPDALGQNGGGSRRRARQPGCSLSRLYEVGEQLVLEAHAPQPRALQFRGGDESPRIFHWPALMMHV